MKKASKLFWVLLPLAMAAIVFVGCAEGGTGTPTPSLNPEHITTDWQVFYIKLVDASREAPFKNLSGLQWIHFHDNTYDGPIGIEVQKVFVSSTAEKGKIPADAEYVVDYTLDSNNWAGAYAEPFSGADHAWTVTTGPNGKASTGVRESTSYEYLGAVGSTKFEEAGYIGFVIKNVSATATAEALRLTLLGDNLAQAVKNVPVPLATILNLKFTPPEIIEPPAPPITIEDWSAFYYEIPEGMQIFSLHVNTGAVEIQKIFVNDSDDESDATYLFDFTADDTYDGNNFWWGADSLDSFVSDGKYVLSSDNDAYVGGGRFGSALFGENKYIGFIIKCPADDYETGLGDVRFLAEQDGNPAVTLATVRFSDLSPSGLNLLDWMIAWRTVDSSSDAIHFHGGQGEIGLGYVEIQKIFVNTSKSLEGATYLFDSTATPSYVLVDNGGNIYWEDNLFGSRVIVLETQNDVDYQYLGGFGTNGLATAEATYMGFIIKSNTKNKVGLADIRVGVLDSSTPAVVNFRDMDIVPLP